MINLAWEEFISIALLLEIIILTPWSNDIKWKYLGLVLSKKQKLIWSFCPPFTLYSYPKVMKGLYLCQQMATLQSYHERWHAYDLTWKGKLVLSWPFKPQWKLLTIVFCFVFFKPLHIDWKSSKTSCLSPLHSSCYPSHISANNP